MRTENFFQFHEKPKLDACGGGESRSQRGIALFMVLWVLALLTVIVGEFCHAMRTELNIVRNFKEETQLYYIAHAGVYRALSELKDIIEEANIARKVEVEYDTEADLDKPVAWRINADNPEVDFGEGKYVVRIGNESGKINLNTANEGMLRMIVDGLDLEDRDKDTIVDSILDWRDADNMHRVNGAENDYYESLPEPYQAKNGNFNMIEELLMVKGVTEEIFYDLGLRDLLTVTDAGATTANPALAIFQKLSAKSSGKANSGKININAASRQMLNALPAMTDDLVQAVVDFRKQADFKSMDEVAQVVGSDIYAIISPFIGLEYSPYYTIVATGKLDGSPALRKLDVMVEWDEKQAKGYRLVQWIDQ